MSTSAAVGRDELLNWMKAYLATLAGRAAENLDADACLGAYDLDSVDAVEMALEFERAFGFAIHPETFLNAEASLPDLAEALSSLAATTASR